MARGSVATLLYRALFEYICPLKPMPGGTQTGDGEVGEVGVGGAVLQDNITSYEKTKSRVGKKTLKKLTHLSPRRTAQKDIIIDPTSNSQVNSNFPHRWSPASLTFNNYFYLVLYLYITRITENFTINNNTPHLKSPKNQKRRAALGRPAMKLLGSFN